MGFFSKFKGGLFVTKCKIAGVKHGMTESSAERIGDDYFEQLVRIGNSSASTYEKIAPYPEWAMGAICMAILEKSNILTPESIFEPADTYAQSFIQSYPGETFLVSELEKARKIARS